MNGPPLARRFVALIVFAVVAAAACIRLGFWQLDRLAQRRAKNAIVIARLKSSPVDVSEIPADTTASHYRRVRVTGVADYPNEIVLGPRTHDGIPGVYVVTPVHPADGGPAVLVNRGWVYSPDAMSLDLSPLHEDTTTFVGYVEPISSGGVPAEIAGHARTLRRLQREALERALPYPVAPVYVVATGDTVRSTTGAYIIRLGEPPIDEGPHKGYAFQWFAFATVALGGVGVIIRHRGVASGPNNA